MSAVSSRVPPPTVDDLRVKLCYICREEELHDASTTSTEGSSRSQRNGPVWVHPCKCTLIAHEQCLLQWIRSAQTSRDQAAKALVCPQCGGKYDLVSERGLSLSLFRLGNALLSKVGTYTLGFVGVGVLSSFGFTLYMITTEYGAFAIRQFVGNDVYDLILGEHVTSWPATAYLYLPTVTLSLLTSDYSGDSNSFFPMLALAYAPMVLAPQPLLTPTGPASLGPSSWSSIIGPAWPPSPFAIAFCAPFIRRLYRRVWERCAQRTFGLRGSRQALAAAWQSQTAEPNVEEDGALARVQVEDQENALAAIRSVVVHAGHGRRIIMGLLTPTIAASAGAGLLWLSGLRYGGWLRAFLAVRETTLKWPVQGHAGTVLRGAGSVAGALGLSSQTIQWWTTRVGRMMWGDARIRAECDPVWWRNALGLGLFIAARDALQLYYFYLAKREFDTRKIKSRPFTGINPAELDLINPRPSTSRTRSSKSQRKDKNARPKLVQKREILPPTSSTPSAIPATEDSSPLGQETTVPKVEAPEIAEWADAAQEILDGEEEQAAMTETPMPPVTP